MSPNNDLVTVQIAGFNQLANKLDAVRVVLRDLRPLWQLLASDFYKTEKQIFQLKGPGQYKDLSDAYKERKRKAHGFTYPILFATGRLASSLLSPNARDSIYEIKPLYMRVGTKDPKAQYHASGTSRMPRRPLWDDRDNSPMLTRWHRTVDRYLEKAVQGAFDGNSGSGSPRL